MTQLPFHPGDMLRYIGEPESFMFKHDRIYTSSGCKRLPDDRFAIGIEELHDGAIRWRGDIWKLAEPATLVDDPNEYTIDEL